MVSLIGITDGHRPMLHLMILLTLQQYLRSRNHSLRKTCSPRHLLQSMPSRHLLQSMPSRILHMLQVTVQCQVQQHQRDRSLRHRLLQVAAQ